MRQNHLYVIFVYFISLNLSYSGLVIAQDNELAMDHSNEKGQAINLGQGPQLTLELLNTAGYSFLEKDTSQQKCTADNPNCDLESWGKTAQNVQKAQKASANLLSSIEVQIQETSSCLEQTVEECSGPAIFPQQEEFYLESLKNFVFTSNYASNKPSVDTKNTSNTKIKRLSQEHCDCLKKNSIKTPSPDEPEYKFIQTANRKMLGRKFVDEFAKFREDFSVFYYNGDTTAQYFNSKNGQLCDDPAKFVEAVPSKCKGKASFDKDLIEYLNPYSRLKANSFTEIWGEMINDMDVIKDSKSGEEYTRKTHSIGLYHGKWTQLNSKTLDDAFTEILKDEVMTKKFFDVVTRPNNISDFFLASNGDKVLSPEGEVILKKVLKIPEDKREILKKLSKDHLKTFIDGALKFHPEIEMMITNKKFRDEIVSEFNGRNGFKKYQNKLNSGEKKGVPSFSGFINENKKLLSSNFEERCKELVKSFVNGICEDPNYVKQNISKTAINEYLVANKKFENNRLIGLGQSFDAFYCELGAGSSVGQSEYDMRCQAGVFTLFSEKAKEFFEENSKYQEELVGMIKNSGVLPDEEILTEIFGDSYTKYFPKPTVSNNMEDTTESSNNSSSSFDYLNKDQTSVSVPQYVSNYATPKKEQQDQGQEIEAEQEVKAAAAARKELNDFFKDSNDPDVKKHLSDLSDEQVMKLQEELQRVREKNASDMASLRSQIDALTQKKEFEAKYDRLQKEYDALKEQNERIARPVTGGNSPYSSASSSNSNSYSGQRPQVGSGSSVAFGNSSSSGRSTANISNSQSSGSIGVSGQAAYASAGESRKVNLTYESKNQKDDKKSGLMVLEVSEVVTGNPEEMASRDLDKYLIQNEGKLDSEKLRLITSAGVLYRFKGPDNKVIEKRIPYAVIEPNVKNRIQYMMKTRKIEREMKEVSYAYLVNIIDQYGKK